MITQLFSVPDMNCTACVMHLEALEDQVDGVQNIDANYKKLRLAVKYDETKTSANHIIAAIKQAGYTAMAQEILS